MLQMYDKQLANLIFSNAYNKYDSSYCYFMQIQCYVENVWWPDRQFYVF